MGTAIKHLVPDRVKQSFVIFDFGHSDDAWCQTLHMLPICNGQRWASKG